jgi:hypothetical protein
MVAPHDVSIALCAVSRFPPTLILLGLSLATGCATARGCPAEGGATWRELTSEHFVLSTDMRSGKARDAITELETLRAAVLTAAFPMASRRPTGRIPVIILDEIEEWNGYFPQNGGMFTRLLWQPLILLYGGNSLNREETIKHELVHYLSRFYLPHQPRWFAEGLAIYFETLEYSTSDKEVVFGKPSETQLRRVQMLGVLSLPVVLEGSDIAYNLLQDRFYATSWLMVHYLANQQPEAFATYQRELQIDEGAAWKKVFGESAVTALDDQLGRYLKGGRYLVLTSHFTAPAVNPTERIPTDAEVHLTRALLHYVGSSTQPHEAPALGRALHNLDEALRQDPGNLSALLARQYLLELPVSETIARAAVRQHPRDWRAWTLLSGALRGTAAADEGTAALTRAKLLAAGDPGVEFDEPRRHH